MKKITILFLFACGIISAQNNVTTIVGGGGTSLPSQAGNAGKYLKTNGTTYSWDSPAGAGTVTSVVAGTGLSGGNITSTGTVSITNTGVSAGSYGSSSAIPVINVNAQGQVTSATTAAPSTSVPTFTITDQLNINSGANIVMKDDVYIIYNNAENVEMYYTPTGDKLMINAATHNFQVASSNFNLSTSGNVDITGNINGVKVTPVSSSTITIANAKVLKVDNTLTFTGTDGTTYKFPSVSGDVALQDIPINISTASYTIALTDKGTLRRMNVASANTLSIPTNASVSFPIGSQIEFSQMGAGQVTITALSGVTLNLSNSKVKTAYQNSVGVLTKVDTNTWLVTGELVQ
jgi:hypothetical protein